MREVFEHIFPGKYLVILLAMPLFFDPDAIFALPINKQWILSD